MKTFNLDEVRDILTSRGVNADVWHSGGGIYTLYVGQPNEEQEYPYAVGPATITDGKPVTEAGDTYGGPHDEGEHTPVLFTEDHTVEDIADLMEAAVQGKVTFPTREEQISPTPYKRP